MTELLLRNLFLSISKLVYGFEPKMNLISALALWSFMSVDWICVAFSITSSAHSVRRHNTDLSSKMQPSSLLTRRNALKHSLIASTISLLNPIKTSYSYAIETQSSNEDGDVFSEFGQSIQTSFFNPQELVGTTSSWPNTPSPLPTMYKTAAELSSSSPPSPVRNVPSSNLEQAIEEAAKKRIIDPRTHG